MKIDKLIQAVKETALGKLIPPEITTVTRDNQGLVQLWWTTKKTGDKERVTNRTWDNLFMNTTGEWRSYDEHAVNVELGMDITTNKAYCRRFRVLEKRVQGSFAGMEEKEFSSSQFVSGILKRIFERETIQPEQLVTSVVGNDYTIKTFYRVDGLTFESIEAAEEHVKCAKIFDLILESNPQAEYPDYQAVVESMVKNHDRFIAIMKG